MKRKSIVSVIGPNDCSEWEARAAESVGRLLAANDITVVCGGRSGVMEAVCRGAHEVGGVTRDSPGIGYGGWESVSNDRYSYRAW